ncbi:hypothetical protein KY289_004612 [Solanum tuberosum]|nr:hypothetical protein KY289_004612 [Solanum tuberosum]
MVAILMAIVGSWLIPMAISRKYPPKFSSLFSLSSSLSSFSITTVALHTMNAQSPTNLSSNHIRRSGELRAYHGDKYMKRFNKLYKEGNEKEFDGYG